jgi:uncharacterized protein
MTPQERQLVDDLFDRLAKLEDAPRDPDAERAIIDGLRRAPNAPYALVQTVLVQDEALKRANARIQELEGGGDQPPEPPRGFLDNMRDTLFGRDEPHRGSVPNARTGGLGSSGAWGAGPSSPPPPPPPGYGAPPQGYGAPPPGYGYGPGPSPVGAGGSFLGTAAASAAGVIGGAMLLNGIRSMMGGSHGGGFGPGAYNPGPSLGSPWGGGDSAANRDLARDAGIDHIGSNRSAAYDSGSGGSGSGAYSGGDESGGRAAYSGGDDQHQTDTAYDNSSDDTDPTAAFDSDDSDPTADFGGDSDNC